MIAKCRLLIVIILTIFFENVNPEPEKEQELNNFKNVSEDAVFHNISQNFGDHATSMLRNMASGRAEVEDKYLNTTELLRKYGYNVEEYYVITEDGYNLTLIRIPSTGPVMFLMHGLPSSSDAFVTSGPHKALAYILANATYDVWIGNARGNKYSKRHVILSTDSREYWDFTWHEIGIYDLPAMIDQALTTSQQTKLTYIGHAQGTTVFFVMCSSRPEYNEKIKLYISLATITWVWHVKSPVARALVPLRQEVYELTQALGLYELLPSSPFALLLTSVVCSSSKFTLLVCNSVLFNLFGYDYSQIDYENSPVQLSHFPAGGSFKQLIHYLQLAASKRFAQYDYGEEMNMQMYNATSPPDYLVQNVEVPVVIFYADNDWLSSFDDVQILIDRLRNVQAIYRVPHARFNHFDYIWGKDAGQLLYFKILDIVNRDYSAEFGVFAGEKNDKRLMELVGKN